MDPERPDSLTPLIASTSIPGLGPEPASIEARLALAIGEVHRRNSSLPPTDRKNIIATLPANKWFQAWSSYALVMLVAFFALATTWATNVDLVVDSGREIYVPWRISQGAVLYRDIAYFNGPLSPYVNALCLHLFGVRLQTVLWVNVVVIALITILLYSLSHRLGGRLTATTVATLFAGGFACAHYGGFGIFSYSMPYSHEMSHGVLIGLACIWCLDRRLRAPRGWTGLAWLGAAAFLAGAILLTKVEFSIALFPAVALGVGLGAWLESGSFAVVALEVFIFTAIATIAVLMPVGLFWRVMPLSEAIHGTAGAWSYLWNRQIQRMPFYQETLGIRDISRQLRLIALSSGFYLLAFVPALWLSKTELLAARGYVKPFLAAIWAAMVIGVSCRYVDLQASVGFPLPIVLILWGVVQLVSFLHRRRTAVTENDSLMVLKLVLTVFSLLLLAKIILNVRLIEYGFALAMPATMMVAVLLIHDIPSWLQRTRPVPESTFRAAALTGFAMLLIAFISRTSIDVAAESTKVHSPRGDVWADETGKYTADALAYLAHGCRPSDTLAVVPEGAMLNFLSGRVNPTRYPSIMPVEMLMFGEDRVAIDFFRHRPDLIAVVRRDTGAYGVRGFGTGYAKVLAKWVADNYHPIAVFGRDAAGRVSDYGIVLYRINSSKPSGGDNASPETQPGI